MQLHADWAITLHCKASCLFVPSQVEDWAVDEPAGEPLERVREIAVLVRVKTHWWR
jgi:hypothetical protein